MNVSKGFTGVRCPHCLREYPIEAVSDVSLGLYRHIKQCRCLSKKAMLLIGGYCGSSPSTMQRDSKGRHKGRNRRN